MIIARSKSILLVQKKNLDAVDSAAIAAVQVVVVVTAVAAADMAAHAVARVALVVAKTDAAAPEAAPDVINFNRQPYLSDNLIKGRASRLALL